MARLGVYTLERGEWARLDVLCMVGIWWRGGEGWRVGGGGCYYGGDNIPVSSCGWQHLNSWLVHDRLVQTSATGAGCCRWPPIKHWFLYDQSQLDDLWKSALTNHSMTVTRLAWPRTRPKIMPRYVWHGPTFPVPHSKTVNQCCLNISSTVGNHLNNTASVVCVSIWHVRCSPNQISLNFIFFFKFFS